MQAVKGPHSEFWPVTASQIGTDVVCIVRNVKAYSQPSISIIFEFMLCSLLWPGLSRRLATELIHNREPRRELAQERKASASSRQSRTPIATSVYRFTPE